MSTQLKSEYVPGSSSPNPVERQPIERLIPYANKDRLRSEADLDRLSATSTEDQKTYWGLGEVVIWIQTRDYERAAAVSELSETAAMVQALFTHGTPLDVRSLLRFATANSEADREAAASSDKIESGLVEGPAPMPPDRALDDLHRKLRSGRLPLTAIKLSRSSNEQIPVPPAELNDLVFRFTPDDSVVPVGLWSRSRDLLVWRSPQFLRSDVTRLWPARKTKTAAVSGAILRHLGKIMPPVAPLTKSEAQRRCMAEVSNAYPGAFKKAWAELEPSFKRGRGKHGSRVH
jgi:hypothetical protein